MLEGMCNGGPTFYRMMKASLKDQVGKNVLSYVHDKVIASKKDDYISDLVETFMNMREARLKLNAEKCIFGITRGKVLGCLVSTKGIEANTDLKHSFLESLKCNLHRAEKTSRNSQDV
jgi:hypothetical protein